MVDMRNTERVNERYPDKPYGWHPNGVHPRTRIAKVRRNKRRRARERCWETVAERDGYRCQNCGVGAIIVLGSDSEPKLDTSHLTIDHIRPLADGGTNDLSNLQVLCRDCNLKKNRKVSPYGKGLGKRTKAGRALRRARKVASTSPEEEK